MEFVNNRRVIFGQGVHTQIPGIVKERGARKVFMAVFSPDAPCVVCEHTGEDHLARDKQNRIRQLDDWLKSGLIDRAEYAVLKDRYERDM